MPHASYSTLILMSETLFPASIVLIKKSKSAYNWDMDEVFYGKLCK